MEGMANKASQTAKGVKTVFDMRADKDEEAVLPRGDFF
jgi:hypothetical protein